jgi:serine/threonine protein kinase
MKVVDRLGVLHRDVMPCNMLCNGDSSEVIVIELKAAKLTPAQPTQGSQLLNHKTKGGRIMT